MRKFYVYFLKSSENDNIFYIGKGSGKRGFKHIQIAKSDGKNKKKNPKLYNKINSIIEKGFEVICDIIFESENEQLCLNLEKEYIINIGIDNLCNLTLGGEGLSGFKLSNETKKKMSDAKKGIKRNNVLMTDEWKNNLSKSLMGRPCYWKGKKLSDETKKKMSDAKKGKSNGPRSIEVKNKISESMKNRRNI